MLLSLTHRPKTHDTEADGGNTGARPGGGTVRQAPTCLRAPAAPPCGSAGARASGTCQQVWTLRLIPRGALGTRVPPSLQMRRPWAPVTKGLTVGRRGEELGLGLCLPQVPAGYQSSWLK